jgi:hypothetical protein
MRNHEVKSLFGPDKRVTNLVSVRISEESVSSVARAFTVPAYEPARLMMNFAIIRPALPAQLRACPCCTVAFAFLVPSLLV